MKGIVLLKTRLLRSIVFTALICCCALYSFAQPETGRSFINVTKGTNGGTIETGDTLEIRASFVVRSGTYDSCGYYDAIPAGTSYIPGTLRVLTNEGKIYKQFTDAYGDDPGYISGSNIRINLGYNTASNPATAFRRGRVGSSYKPSFYGSACIMIASFRVVVTASTGNTVNISGGNMTYKSGSLVRTLTLNSKTIEVYPNYGICSNTVGTNAIGTESNGTFGSGTAKDRGTSANVPTGYTYNTFGSNSPQDYYYGISNNTSTTNYTTSNAWPIPDNSSPSHRVFGVWDIIGDHTGAASPTAGNPAADTTVGGGYMLVINSAYRIDSAFVQTISGLCPNTYYEISCWMRNICSYCGCDSNGKGASSAGYIPTDVGDSSGVYPNLTFQVDGIDYYTTGNLKHTGEWVKKGFTYLTGPTQNSFNLKFFNNAPGGGGNDWALDDISVATCSPSMVYSPSNNPTVCKSNTIAISDTITSYFNNYTYYKWQRSTDGGATWADKTGVLGPASPYSTSGGWQYVTSYTVPPSDADSMNNGDLYRVVVATTSSNLSDASCSFSDAVKIITLNVIDCGTPLNVRLISFTGKAVDGKTSLTWSTSQENEPLTFDVERSYDGMNFSTIATVPGYSDYNASVNIYTFNDPEQLTRPTYYRIKMKTDNAIISLSRVVQVASNPTAFSFISVINPFNSSLVFDISSDRSGRANMELVDQFGTIVRKNLLEIIPGINHLELNNTDILPAGIYILRIQLGDLVLQKKVLKQKF
ncbi:MAG TPA: T9SS type A sorting domain-containing protein [Chitinophagaceae bacterium]|jgi:hypothetical protein|nr:T9SS type A sorting domain-containing protein [Chitinophagaceae bacterium]